MHVALNFVAIQVAGLILASPTRIACDLQNLKERRISRHQLREAIVNSHVVSYAGIEVESLTFQLGRYFAVQDRVGVVVRTVHSGSRGDRAGVHAGDVIIKIQGQQIRSTSQFIRVLRGADRQKTEIQVVRSKETMKVSLNGANE